MKPSVDFHENRASLSEHHLCVAGAILESNGVKHLEDVIDEYVLSLPGWGQQPDLLRRNGIRIPWETSRLLVNPNCHTQVLTRIGYRVHDVLVASQELLQGQLTVEGPGHVPVANDASIRNLQILFSPAEKNAITASPTGGFGDQWPLIAGACPRQELFQTARFELFGRGHSFPSKSLLHLGLVFSCFQEFQWVGGGKTQRVRQPVGELNTWLRPR
mmetsp:Transcript_1605/g.3655  ORF Transcript_1605/g.3655 Transcript_1605/m.3655 type:complete len:216 (-) Transcript_1605:342-989(-)